MAGGGSSSLWPLCSSSGLLGRRGAAAALHSAGNWFSQVMATIPCHYYHRWSFKWPQMSLLLSIKCRPDTTYFFHLFFQYFLFCHLLMTNFFFHFEPNFRLKMEVSRGEFEAHFSILCCCCGERKSKLFLLGKKL